MRRTRQYRSPRWAVLTCALAVGACTEIRDSMQDAASTMDRMFGTELGDDSRDYPGAEPDYTDAGPRTAAEPRARAGDQAGPAAPAGADAIFQDALAARDRGAEEEALRGFHEAAHQGHPRAQFVLGEVYSLGRGVAKNSALAARWYGKAAHRGLPDAQYAYGLVHTRGLGLPIDGAEGYRWLLLAARNGHERAEVVRRTIEPKLSQEAIVQAEQWVGQFVPQPSPAFADRPTVMFVQQTLNTLGYGAGPVDGELGRRTRGAVGKFQQKTGIARDGEITPDLVDALTGH